MKLLILEDEKSQIDSRIFDKVISFCRDDFVNIETYYSYSEYFELYDQVYYPFVDWLKANACGKCFSFEGVDVLSAFGKTIFDFIFNLYQKIYILRKIVARESPTEISLLRPRTSFDIKYPYLSFFAADFLPGNIVLNYIDIQGCDAHPVRSEPSFFLKYRDFLLDLIRLVGSRVSSKHKRNILLYSDFLKIPKLLDSINGERVVFLEKANPKRHLVTLLKKRVKISLFNDFPNINDASVRLNSSALMDRLDKDLTSIVIKGTDLTVYLKKHLKSLWGKNLSQTLVEIQQLRSLFASHPIETVLLDEDRTVSKNLVAQVASLCGRKSFVNCHGDPAHKIGYLPLTSDSIIVWGQQQKDLFREWGLSESRILVAGSSKYDGFINIPESDLRRKVFRDFNLKGDQPLLLLAPCPLEKRRNILDVFFWREIKNIISVVAALSDRANVVIKLHPGDDNDQSIKEFVRTIAPKIRVIKTYDSLFLAKACDAMVVYLSTFSIDGLAFRKPVVLGAGHDYERFDCLKYFYDGTTSDKLRDSLVDILEGTATKHLRNWLSAADYVLSSMDGNSSKRIADMLSSGVGTDLAAQYQFAPQRYGENER